MAFTRIRDDKNRVETYLKQAVGPGHYQINVPGQGMSPDYMDDPHFRLERWGDNLSNNAINLESDLRGLTRNLNRDEMEKNLHLVNAFAIEQRAKSKRNDTTTDQTRVTHPAWHYRDEQHYRPEHLLYDPQEHIKDEFISNVSSRYEQKK